MTRLRIRETPFWQSLKGEPRSPGYENLSAHGQLFYRFDDEKWHIHGQWTKDRAPSVGLSMPRHRAVLCVGREELKPLLNVAIHICVTGDHVSIEECTMKLVSASEEHQDPVSPRPVGVEVASLPRQAIRFTSGDEPRQVVVVSWGLISIRLSAYWKGLVEPPVVIASFACELPSPHEEYVRRAMSA